MGARYLKEEEEAIRECYPTSTRNEIKVKIPHRSWLQISSHARCMGIHRSSKAWGNSVREGRRELKGAYSDDVNDIFDRIYPTSTYAKLLAAFPNRTLKAIKSHAQRRHLHRTREARTRQMQIGREEAKRKRE